MVGCLRDVANKVLDPATPSIARRAVIVLGATRSCRCDEEPDMADYSLLLRSTRPTAALAIQDEAARLAARRPQPLHVNNGEEAAYRGPGNSLTYIANYSKALPHRRTGEVQQPAYRALLRAMYGGDPQLFEQIPVGRLSGLT